MKDLKGAAVSANLLGDFILSDPKGSQNKRDVRWLWHSRCAPEAGVGYLAMNFSAFTASNDKL
jgi:hypothetical protein